MKLEFDDSAPARGRRGGWFAYAGWVLFVILLGVVLAFSTGLFRPHPTVPPDQTGVHDAAHPAQLWTCGMHPQVIQDHPGQCPICGMNLVPLAVSPTQAPSEAIATQEHSETANTSTIYTCPMHPEVREDHPGACPICGMDLVPVANEEAGTAASAAPASAPPAAQRKILFYRSPMDPSITSPVPRKDEMGMDYVPVYADDAAGAAAQGAVVTIDPTVIQNMNVVVQPVSRRDVSRRIRTVGYLDYDQEKMVSVTTKYPGYVEKSFVNYLGQPVTKGEPLFQIYSPELVQTEQELLAAVRYVAQLSGAPDDAQARARSLLAAARTRLSYWDISDAQIADIEKRGEVMRTLTVYAPSSGVVMKRMEGLEGMAVKPGMELIHLAGISDLWLRVEVYEDQLPYLNVGSRAQVTLAYFPGDTFSGTVRYVEPSVSDKTRTLGLTLAIPNPQGRLRPGMYATVVFEPTAARDAITVPSNAVIRTGERNLVVVALGGGRFAPRDVELGAEGDGFVEIRSGLADSDRVVTSAQFLIDSESNIREAIQKMIEARRAPSATAPPSPSGH